MTSSSRIGLAVGIGLLGFIPMLQTPHGSDAHDRSFRGQTEDSPTTAAIQYYHNDPQRGRFNGVADANRLQPGQTLIAPNTTTYEGTESAPTNQFTPANQMATVASRSGAGLQTLTGAGYTVVPGDTLSGLSYRFGVSMAALAAANGISRPDMLMVGQHLMIPGQAGASRTITSQGIVPAMNIQQANTDTAPILTGVSSIARPNIAVSPSSQTSVGALLTSQAQAYGIDPALVKAVAWQESGWRMVVASDGGVGVMQLMPATAAWVGPSLLGRTIDPYNLQDNIAAGVALIASYLKQYGGNVQLALAAYNEGPLNLRNGILPSTARYIANVLSLRASYAQ